MNKVVYGYVRVSTKEQNEARQLTAMQEFGVSAENMIVEKYSGKDFRRPHYQKLLKRLRRGDVLAVKSIDRLGRNYKEILEQWQVLTKEIGVDVVVLDMPLLDTRQGRDLTGQLIADIMLQLLSYVAETERKNIRQRQAEGIMAAKKQGVHLGCKQMTMPAEFYDLAAAWRQGEISSRAAADRLGISYQTFLRRAKETAVRSHYMGD